MAHVFAAAQAARLAGQEHVLAFLRSHEPTQRVSLSISSSGRRGLRPTAELMRLQAAAAGCRVALAETGSLASHWIDAIVWGTAADLENFLTSLGPALTAAAGRGSRHQVGAIVAA